jgi:hypothetical protein
MEAHYTRLFADDQGESCFEDVAMELHQAMLVEGIEALPSAPFLASEATFWVGSTTSWKGEALHTSPRRFILVGVTGEYAVTTSEGVTRRFGPGSVLLAEDTTGKGHSTRTISNGYAFCVALAVEGAG